MKISTRSRYGLKLLFELALIHGKGHLMLGEIARRHGLSEMYLVKLIFQLRRSGLVASVRGAHGGYILAREPGAINLREAVLALEGKIQLFDCVGNAKACVRSDQCAIQPVWQELGRRIQSYLEGITLQDMVNDFRAAAGAGPDCYQI